MRRTTGVSYRRRMRRRSWIVLLVPAAVAAATLISEWTDPSPRARADGAGASSLTNPINARIDAGAEHTCVVTDDGQVSCWGTNQSGQLGVSGVLRSLTPTGPVALPAPGRAQAVATGEDHTCALLAAGQVSCWGDDSDGQLGNGPVNTTLEVPSPPIALPSPGTARAITAGYKHTCVVLTDGGVACWGDNNWGQLGTGVFGLDADAPVRIVLPGPGTATAVAAGTYNTCALLTDSTVTCWGSDSSQQLGNGPTMGDQDLAQPPVALPSPGRARAIAIGDAHVCAVLTSGGISCWGEDGDGQLGNGPVVTADGDVPGPPLALPGGQTAISVTGGDKHTCAVLADGAVSCWGANDRFQLGDGTDVDFVDVPELSAVTSGASAVVAGETHTCALVQREVSCWGNDQSGQIGNGAENGDQSVPSTPLTVPTVASVRDVAVGAANACARSGAGKVSCWGDDTFGATGNGPATGALDSPPEPIALTGSAVQVSVGGVSACALSANGLVRCWGADFHGVLGNGAGSAQVDAPGAPITLPAPGTAAQITVGFEHACALLTDSAVTCWGGDTEGELGNGAPSGNETAPPAPITLPAPGTATAIDTGPKHVCAVLTGGAVTCWGLDSDGQLGNGASGSQTSPPAPIALPGGASATSVSVGDRHSCALLTTGAVACWGNDDFGQMGDSADLGHHETATLVPLPGPGTATEIDAGGDTTCVVLTGGAVSCWGAGRAGQVGSGDVNAANDAASAPVALPGPGTAEHVSVGVEAVCAVLTDFTFSCWGSDEAGVVGDGAIEPGTQLVPSAPFPARGRTVTAEPVPVVGLQAVPTPTALNITWSLPAPQTLTDIFVIVSPSGQVVELDGDATSTIVSGLDPDVTYTVTVRDGHDFGKADSTIVTTTPSLPPPTTAPPTTTPGVSPPAAVDFIPVTPARLLDTRTDPGRATIDGLFLGGGRRDAGSTLALQVAGRAGASATAEAAALNVTVTEAAGAGFVTVYPCDEPRPNASNLNFLAGDTVPNAVIAALAADGTVCLFTSQPTHLLVDIDGEFPAGTSYRSLNPARLLETRSGPGLVTVDGLFAGAGRVVGSTAVEVQIAGRGGVAIGSRAVALNVTAVDPAADGFATVYPCDRPRPNASNLNFAASPGTRPQPAGANAVANAVVMSLSATGTVCVYVSQSTDLIIDVNGSFPSASPIVTLDPARLLDTRPPTAGGATVDGLFAGAGRVSAGSTTSLQVAGRGGVPSNATAVVLNVTAVDADAPGFVSVFPCDQPRPNASNVNFFAGETVPNAVLAALSAAGTVCVFSSQPLDLVADVNAVLTRAP